MEGHAKRAGKARLGFYIHLAAYLAVNALLVSINLATSPDRLWCKWPLLGWGLGLLAHALATFGLPMLRGGRGPCRSRADGGR
jgi:hypothetical protein